MKPFNQINEKIIQKAGEFTKYFTRIKKHDPDNEILILKKLAPEELKNLVQNAHADFLPDDFRYDFIYEALQAFADCQVDDDLDDIFLEAAIYNHRLIEWLGSNIKRVGYCDEAQSEYGLENPDVMALITHGQQMEKDEVLALVREALISLCT